MRQPAIARGCASSGWNTGNLLIHQAQREVLERQLEQTRLGLALERMRAGRVTVLDLERPSPLAFPLLVDRNREHLSTEQLNARIRRLASR